MYSLVLYSNVPIPRTFNDTFIVWIGTFKRILASYYLSYSIILLPMSIYTIAAPVASGKNII